jgi:hypothetical protein
VANSRGQTKQGHKSRCESIYISSNQYVYFDKKNREKRKRQADVRQSGSKLQPLPCSCDLRGRRRIGVESEAVRPTLSLSRSDVPQSEGKADSTLKSTYRPSV